MPEQKNSGAKAAKQEGHEQSEDERMCVVYQSTLAQYAGVISKLGRQREGMVLVRCVGILVVFNVLVWWSVTSSDRARTSQLFVLGAAVSLFALLFHAKHQAEADANSKSPKKPTSTTEDAHFKSVCASLAAVHVRVTPAVSYQLMLRQDNPGVFYGLCTGLLVLVYKIYDMIPFTLMLLVGMVWASFWVCNINMARLLTLYRKL